MKIIDLAYSAGRKRQSPQTGFIHHCYEGVDRHETIPLFENFCFALTLFRTKSVENILEGKTLLERLLAFQVGDNFPVYLHEYPTCRDLKQNSKIFPVLFWLERDFHTVLGEPLRERVRHLLNTIPKPAVPEMPSSPEAWAKFLVAAQLEGREVAPAFAHYDPEALAYVGPQKQERGEPALTLYDLFMGQATGVFSKRALTDHPAQLAASLIQPFSSEPSLCSPKHSELYYWSQEGVTHSLHWEYRGERVGESEICLSGEAEVEAMEIAYYVNLHPQTKILINGKRATTFHLGDEVCIETPGRRVRLVFSLASGEGTFFGHILRANRSSQIATKGECRYEAYDWKIGLRTVRRGASCVVKCLLDVS